MKILTLAGCFVALFGARATTWISNGADTGGSGSYVPGTQSVQYIESNFAQDGDTIVIPSGSYTWPTGVTVTNAVSIQSLTILACPPISGLPTQSPPVFYTLPSVNITFTGGGSAFTITGDSYGNTQLAGIAFSGNSSSGSYIYTNQGQGNPVIIQDCVFHYAGNNSSNIFWYDTGGLFFNCWFDQGPQLTNNNFAMVVRGGPPWYNASTLGALDTNGNQNLYIEQCQMDNFWYILFDCDDLCRINIRYSVISNCVIVTHGITSQWGGRQLDLNNNVIQYYPVGNTGVQYNNMGAYYNASGTGNPNGTWANVNRYYWCRGGTGRIWNNACMPIYSNGYYAERTMWMFIDEPLTRPGAGNGNVCETEANYPGTRWAGTGTSAAWAANPPPTGRVLGATNTYLGTASPVDPWYIWNNTTLPPVVSGAQTTAEGWGTNDQTGYGCTAPGPGNQTSDVFLLNRDIFLSAPNNNPSPPYSAFPFPHPLRAGGSTPPSPVATPPAPQNLRIVS